MDTKPVNMEEIPQEVARQQKELEKSIAESNETDANVQETEETEVVNLEGGGCLIATATYGSEMAPQVQLLREIRDSQIMNTNSGASFMGGFNQWYYSFSPYIADMERESPAFKETVRIGITPLLSSLSIMSYAESEAEVAAYGIGVILMNLGMYVAAPVMIVYKIKSIL